MKRFPLRAVPAQLVLLFKRTIALTVIGSAAAAAGFGTDDILQADVQDIRQSIKQGNKHVRRGEFAEAEKIFDRVAKAHPQSSEAKLRLAFVYLKQRRLRDAYDLSYAVAKSDPENSYAFAVLGSTLLSAGKFAEARIIFTNALRLNREEALAWAGYGMPSFAIRTSPIMFSHSLRFRHAPNGMLRPQKLTAGFCRSRAIPMTTGEPGSRG
jgi:tetratricopeptide (TPR) repeat protein